MLLQWCKTTFQVLHYRAKVINSSGAEIDRSDGLYILLNDLTQIFDLVVVVGERFQVLR